MITQVLESSAVWGVLLTLAAFGLGVLINKRTGKAIFNPLLLGTAFVIVVLSVLNIPYDTYAASALPISYLLLPATVSLAVPLYEKWDLLCKNLVAIVAGVLAGVMASLFSVLALALLLDLNHEQYITLLPKSVTTAISMACKSAHRSITPAAAGTNSSGKMPVRNSAAVRTCSSLTTPKRSAASSSISPYTLAGMGSGSTRWQTSPAKQNAAMRANSNTSFIYAFLFFPAVPPLPPCAK